MVRVGQLCMDRYEASVWSSPTGGTQYGVDADDYPCNDQGHNCRGEIYARSVPGVRPSAYITWFQAQQALANSGKRLPSNAEWQMAAAGTPSSAACPIDEGGADFTVPGGSFASCISDWGINDMVGNVEEWVADWAPRSAACPGWGAFSNDKMCLAGAVNSFAGPGAPVRGGHNLDDTDAGPFAIDGFRHPQERTGLLGFRGAR
jgi:formylglycine-generating enzyme required for sulfatase activity